LNLAAISQFPEPDLYPASNRMYGKAGFCSVKYITPDGKFRPA